MLAQQVHDAAQTQWGASTEFDPMTDETLRFCVDYKKGKYLIKHAFYFIPRMNECIKSLGETAIFSTLDAYSVYFQIAIEETDRDQISFTSHQGLNQFICMLF